MINILLCDDEEETLSRIRKYLDSVRSEMKHPIAITEYSSAESVLKRLRCPDEISDILITDIDMPELSGMEMARVIREERLNVLLIFMTAHAEYVFQSFEYAPFRYIRKEFMEKELLPALQAACDRIDADQEISLSMTEEERQANIALGMKKAEYAAENFIPENQKQKFLDAMETVAKIASAGTADRNGKMNYGIKKSSYLGHGSNLVETTDTLDMMKNMDSEAYEEYLRIGEESDEEDRVLKQAKFLTNWYINSVKKKPGMLEEYEKINAKHLERVKDQELSHHFDNINVSGKETFLAGLRDFMSKNQKFMSGVLSVELSDRFWKR